MNKLQVFLLHFAGGNAYSFQFLKKHFRDEIELHMLELPGRGRRVAEPLLTKKEAAVADYVHQIQRSRTDLPYIIYGHSMGATLGLEVAAAMEQTNDPPVALIVSGNAGPGTGAVKNRYLMNKPDFKDELRVLGGIQEEVLNHEELFDFFEPIMRADFEILESEANRSTISGKLRTPIVAVMGSEEETVESISNWKQFTTGSFQQQVVSGNHFFIHDHPQLIVQLIQSLYDRTLVYGY